MFFLCGELDDLQPVLLAGFHRIAAFFKEIFAAALNAVQENPAYRAHGLVSAQLESSMKNADIHAHPVPVDDQIVAVVKKSGHLVWRKIMDVALLNNGGVFFLEFLFNTTFKRSDGSSLGLDIVKNI